VVVGGVLGLFRFAFRDFLAAQGRITAVSVVDLVFPVARLTSVVLLLAVALLDTDAAIYSWLMAVALQVFSGGALLRSRLRLIPSVDIGALRQQLWFGARGHAGWLLQSLNHRFDVFILGYFSGTSAVGYYAVAFNLAEMTWWMPMALGTALFPRASTLDPDANAALTASVVRRALPLTFCSILGMMVVGQPIIILLYGSAFEESVAPFLILAPSGIFYTVYRLLSISLSAQGKPQASLYGGLVSVPIMLGANLALTPSFGAVGAAIASDVAYGTYAGYLIWYFRRSTAMPLQEVFLPTRRDIAESFHFALGLMSRLTSRLPRPAMAWKR
jgi:O-antigen/teichoic acid export membrane protein